MFLNHSNTLMLRARCGSITHAEIWLSHWSAGATSFTGKEKKVWEAKQMEALGGIVHFKEKMPFKMAMGVLKVRASARAFVINE